MQNTEVTPALVSVVIPVYNAQQYIGETIRSVLAQTYRNFEVLIVDDGSTDQTACVVEQFRLREPRIQVLRQKNQGVGVARNRGIDEARGEFVAPVDADDLWAPTKLQKQVECFRTSSPQTGLVYTWSVKINEKNQVLGQSTGQAQGDVLLDILCSNFIGNASAPLIRRVCFDRVGCYNSDFKKLNAQGCEDWDLYLRIAEVFEFQCVRECLTKYRVYRESMSGDYCSMERSYLEMVRSLRQRHPEIPKPLLQWSGSNYYFYLAGKSSTAGNFRRAILWLVKCIGMDPLRLFSSRWHKAWVVALLSGFAGPAARAIAEGRHPWRVRPTRIRENSRHTFVRARHKNFFEMLRARRLEQFRNEWRIQFRKFVETSSGGTKTVTPRTG